MEEWTGSAERADPSVIVTSDCRSERWWNDPLESVCEAPSVLRQTEPLAEIERQWP